MIRITHRASVNNRAPPAAPASTVENNTKKAPTMKPVAAQLANGPVVNSLMTEVYISWRIESVCLESGSICFWLRMAAPRK